MIVRRSRCALAAAVVTLMNGCGDSGGGNERQSIGGTVVVFAASSLTEAFTEIGDAFGNEFPDVTVTFNFAGSGELVTQLTQGAPADVFVSADESNLAELVEAGGASGDPEVIARNTMAIIVEPGNPRGITALADLADPELITVVCAATAPCGAAAATVLNTAGVELTPASLEDRVKGVVTKVTTGEADAGIVFVTDVAAAGSAATGVEIPEAQNVVTAYPMSLTAVAPNPVTARAFMAFVTAPTGSEILASYGFLPPS